MTDREALLAISRLLSAEVWTPDTLDAIAQIMREAGYDIEDVDDGDTETL